MCFTDCFALSTLAFSINDDLFPSSSTIWIFWSGRSLLVAGLAQAHSESAIIRKRVLKISMDFRVSLQSGMS